MWEFVVPEDEQPMASSSSATAEYRPNRMGLGCSKEIIQEKISDNAKKSRLIKLLKRKGDFIDDGFVASAGHGVSVENSEDEECKSKSVKKREFISPSIHKKPTVEATNLTKSQKKRMRKKQLEMQKKLVS